MNDLLAAALLGVVQGITEFLPISSTAHLALAERALGLDPSRYGLSFTVALHLGTLVAVLIYFFRTWLELIVDAFRGRFGLLILLVIATIPAGIAGILFDEAVEGPLRDPIVIAAALAIGSVVFLLAESMGRANERAEPTRRDALVIGIAQALALVPGLSRSGMTISAGLVLGIRRDQAARLSFVLSTPAVVAAAAKTFLDASKADALLAQPEPLAVGFAASFISGLIAIWGLVRFLRRNSLAWFVPYRFLLAAAILVALALEGLG
ncbi:MAG TPA: undecaprenyl-diphosphate phosphatase [Candidatus Limnocylindria bacterium]|nr:undecaprenyl-diphosphate phosphatase [Candidatus Limnocylindria bacterium]